MTETHYERIVQEALTRLYQDRPEDLEACLPAIREGDRFLFRAFGQDCILGPDRITLSGRAETGPRALLIALYARHASSEPIQRDPFRSFKEFPDAMPYHGAFSVNTERVLVPRVPQIREVRETILEALDGDDAWGPEAGDVALLLHPLPKIALGYIFYLPDEDFPASATCLFSANAHAFMPLDGLADVGEYTSKAILEILEEKT